MYTVPTNFGQSAFAHEHPDHEKCWDSGGINFPYNVLDVAELVLNLILWALVISLFLLSFLFPPALAGAANVKQSMPIFSTVFFALKAVSIGAGLPINDPIGQMIIDIGGGTSEMAVISLGGVVSCASVRVGGDKLDQAISEYIRKRHNLAIGDRTAEKIKIKIGSALPQEEETVLSIQGRDLVGGLPKTIEIKGSEITEAISDQLREIIKSIKNVLQGTPPELIADIMDHGMVLSGGGALLRNLDNLISEAVGVTCRIAKEPLLCVAKGAGTALDHLEIYKRSIMSKK